MTSKILLFCFVTLSLPFSNTRADSRTYHPVRDSHQGSGVTFHVSYSLGTHDGTAETFTGNLDLKSTQPLVASGQFQVPIRSLKTGNAERDCHLLESLGLNYADTQYPGDHVCDDKNQLPETGKNAVVFPDITLKIISVAMDDPQAPFQLDHEAKLQINGEWTIHGVTRSVKFPIKMSPVGKQLRLQGELPFSLKDYGITVKSAHALFVKISVSDTATAVFDVLLE
jgi:polyisoprenoid-binding protein YceI